jgi:Ca2+-binding RTX toxin-like protein
MRTLSGVTALACGALLTLSVPAAASATSTPTCFGKAATIVGTTGDDSLTGTTGPDVIVGLSGNDSISGLEGDDRLCGGKGADTLVGGDGDDHLSGGRDLVEDVTDDGDLISFGDDLDGGPGNDELDPGWQNGLHEFDGWVGDVIRFPGATSGLHVDLEAGTAVGEGEDVLDLADVDSSLELLGSPQSDVIRGTALDDWIDPGGGDDTVLLGGGDDFVNSDGSDSGDDTYRGGRGSDVLSSGGGQDVVDGGDGADFLSATQRGTARTVTVLGGDGDDVIGFSDRGSGSPQGDYTYRGGPGRDWFVPQVDGRHAAPMQVDLATHAIDVGEDSATFGGFEQVDLSALHGAVEVAGTPGRDKLSVTAASVTADLGRGPDDLLVSRSGEAEVDLGPGPDHLRLTFVRHGAVAHLGSGDDHVTSVNMEAKFGLQTLYGGAGRDAARLFGRHFACHGIEKVTFPS